MDRLDQSLRGAQELVNALRSPPKFESEIEEKIAKIKSRIEARTDQKAIKKARKLDLDTEEEIKRLARAICRSAFLRKGKGCILKPSKTRKFNR